MTIYELSVQYTVYISSIAVGDTTIWETSFLYHTVWFILQTDYYVEVCQSLTKSE